jgi:hypothetical protein
MSSSNDNWPGRRPAAAMAGKESVPRRGVDGGKREWNDACACGPPGGCAHARLRRAALVAAVQRWRTWRADAVRVRGGALRRRPPRAHETPRPYLASVDTNSSEAVRHWLASSMTQQRRRQRGGCVSTITTRPRPQPTARAPSRHPLALDALGQCYPLNTAAVCTAHALRAPSVAVAAASHRCARHTAVISLLLQRRCPLAQSQPSQSQDRASSTPSSRTRAGCPPAACAYISNSRRRSRRRRQRWRPAQ